MTREQAIAKVRVILDAPWDPKTRLGNDAAGVEVAILEAFGLLKFEEPVPVTFGIPAISYTADKATLDGRERTSLGAGMANIREDTLIETLRMAGYFVTKPGQA